jgi:hypothetical protein
MGEEISMSIRFWTSGYDIYAPALDVLRHEYVRKHGPKFWESVGMCFSNGGLHNALADLIIPRVQLLVGWKDEPARIQSVYTRSEQFANGNKRSADEFVEAMNIDKLERRQSPPTWCTRGEDMPDIYTVVK